MTVRCTAFFAASLDGFVARPDGSIDWLDAAVAAAAPTSDLGFASLLASVDGMVMGRVTFEKVLSFGLWPYGELPLHVVTRRGVAIPDHLRATVTASDEQPGDLVARLSREGRRHLYVDGGQLLADFFAADLIDRLIVTTVPVMLGSGLRAFGPLPADRAWRHLSTEADPCGFVQHRYERRQDPVTG